VCRYIIDPQSEGVLLPTKGDDANKHQKKYKISSHVQAFLKQFAQWRSEKQFEAAGPWRLFKASNSKLEVQGRQRDMTGGAMFQAMYILAPNSSVGSVSCALPNPKSLVMGAKPASASGVPLPSTKSKAGGKSKAVDKVMCTYCKEMFGKKGIRNHEAKCAKQYGTQPTGWQHHKYQPPSDHDDDNDWDAVLNSGFKGKKKTNSRTQPPPSATPSAAADAAQTPEQLLAKAEKELKALRKKHKALQPQAKPKLPSSTDYSYSSSHSSPEKKKKKSKEKKKSGQRAAELRAKAKLATAAATAEEAAEAAAGKRKKKKKKKEKKEKKKKKKDADSSCSDDSSNSTDGSGDSPPSSSDDNGHRRRKKQRRKQQETDAVRKSHKRRSAPTTGGVLSDWYVESRTSQAILEERARASKRMYELVHNHLRNWFSDCTFGCVGTRGPRCRPSCCELCYRQSPLRAALLTNVHKCSYSYSYSYSYS
jgi:hypothetical protein